MWNRSTKQRRAAMRRRAECDYIAFDHALNAELQARHEAMVEFFQKEFPNSPRGKWVHGVWITEAVQ